MTKKCEFIKADGTRCLAFALSSVEPPRCLFHSQRDVVQERSAGWELKRIGKELNNQISELCHARDSVTRERLTLDVIATLHVLEKELTVPPPEPEPGEEPYKQLTLAEKLALFEPGMEEERAKAEAELHAYNERLGKK